MHVHDHYYLETFFFTAFSNTRCEWTSERVNEWIETHRHIHTQRERENTQWIAILSATILFHILIALLHVMLYHSHDCLLKHFLFLKRKCFLHIRSRQNTYTWIRLVRPFSIAIGSLHFSHCFIVQSQRYTILFSRLFIVLLSHCILYVWIVFLFAVIIRKSDYSAASGTCVNCVCEKDFFFCWTILNVIVSACTTQKSFQTMCAHSQMAMILFIKIIFS